MCAPSTATGCPARSSGSSRPSAAGTTLVRPGERIAVKINLLRGAAPEKAVSTHPETLRHVLRALRSAGARAFVADSPGGLNGPAKVARAYHVSGIADVCREEDVQIIDVEDERTVIDAPQGRLFRSFKVGRAFVTADGIVQVGVLKTHQLMRLTGGVKLTFGCIPGLSKAQLHVRAERREDFADMLLDLHLAVAPRFTIIDGIIAMDGQGPGSGRAPCTSVPSSRLGTASRSTRRSPIVRVTSATQVQVLAAAERRGLMDLDRPYRLAGDPIEAEPYFRPAALDAQERVPAPLRRAVRNLLTARPRLVDEPACTWCGECAAICGVDAINSAADAGLRRPSLRALLRLHRGLPDARHRQRRAPRWAA